MFAFDRDWIVVKAITTNGPQYGFSHVYSAVEWDSFNNKPVEILSQEKWPTDAWASLAYCAINREGVKLAAQYLPFRLFDMFHKQCGSLDFGDQMPLYIFLMRSLVACHKEAGAEIRLSAKEAQKLLDEFNAI